MSKFRQLYPEYNDVSDRKLYPFHSTPAPSEPPWATLGTWAAVAFGIPLVVLALGSFLVWAFSGFAAKRNRTLDRPQKELILAQKNSVSPQYLLEGAAYALEQCGLLLRDANLLYERRSYASAVTLAAFAQEELGRWKMLHDLRRKVIRGDSVTIKEIQTRCGDHVRKQEAGGMSVVTRADIGTGVAKLHETLMTATPGSEEWKSARKEIEELDRRKKKRVPGERHEQRMSALYVDAVSPDQWNRPTNKISPTLAFERLQDAANDYSMQYDRYTNPQNFKPDDPKLYTALEKWTDRPTLAPPERLLPPS